MPRLVAALAWLSVSSAACLPAHAPVARKVGMVASVAGVLGLMATAAVQSYTSSDEALAAFSMMSGGGIIVFALGELSLPQKGPRQETETEKHRRWARILTERASGAAREGRCPRVRRLEKRVNVYDREVHDFVFMRDGAILKCLAGAPETAPELDADRPATDHEQLPSPVPLPAPTDPNAPPPTLPPSPADPDAPSPKLITPVPPSLTLPPGTVLRLHP